MSLGRKASDEMAALTFSVVSGRTPTSPLTTRETVLRLTPAWRATSRMVGRMGPLLDGAGQWGNETTTLSSHSRVAVVNPVAETASRSKPPGVSQRSERMQVRALGGDLVTGRTPLQAALDPGQEVGPGPFEVAAARGQPAGGRRDRPGLAPVTRGRDAEGRTG